MSTTMMRRRNPLLSVVILFLCTATHQHVVVTALSSASPKYHHQSSTTTSTTSTTSSSRAQFLSKTATSGVTYFLTSVGYGWTTNPKPSIAATTSSAVAGVNTKDNPRYIDEELEMKYGEDSKGNAKVSKVFVRRFTGDSTPYTFNKKPIKLTTKWPDQPSFSSSDFLRADQFNDTSFYAVPRFVYHIDEPAVASLTQYYRNNIKPGSDILDICSSWVSHYPIEFTQTMKRISGTGISGLELQYNNQLTDYTAKDLNVEPIKLPYDDKTFDVVTCVVSIDYLIQPIDVLKEVYRVLRPGGKVIISQSNRYFPSKAINMWLRMTDKEHLELINGYFQYAGGFDEPRKAYDITATVPAYVNPYPNNPMFIVEATKKR